MEAIKFFNATALQLPLCRGHGDCDFEVYLDGVFTRYLAEFDKITPSDPLAKSIKEAKPEAEKLCAGVKKALSEYLGGFPHGAFDAIKTATGCVERHFKILRLGHNIAGIPDLQELYRIRAEKPNEEPKGMWFRRGDLFHIPFEKRHLVARQRYSIPGLPCLYLGQTLYVCWEELERPPFHSLYVARFCPRKGTTIRLLDFSARPAATARFIESEQDDINPFTFKVLVARAVCWPLMAACSVRRYHRASPFIAEYIVPQLILQWVAQPNEPTGERLDGIVYFSVNSNPLPDNDSALRNFVFPVQKQQPEGHCPVLKEMFELTQAASWQLLENSSLPGRPTRHSSIEIPLAHETFVSYAATPFGIVEERLAPLGLRPFRKQGRPLAKDNCEGVKLHFGPYKSPALGRGDRVACLACSTYAVAYPET